ncbi:unnamed protein product, partial [Closterium sp. NIES-53]
TPDPESDRARAVSPTVSRLLATAVSDPSFESTAVSALVAELLYFAAACRLDYTTALVCPPSVGGDCALGTDVLEDRKEDFECLTAAVPHFASMLLAPEGDPDAPDIPTPHSYTEAITGPYSSQWQAAMDAEMASWKSTGTYVDEVPPPGANIVDGMWIFRVKRALGSRPAFKACYVARGFSQRSGVDYFQTFSPTPKMTTLWVLLHVAAQRDYKLHSLDFSTAFLQCSLHEEIWLRRPPGFTGSFPTALGFAPSSADPSMFLRTDTSLPLFYVLVYVDDLVFATADTKALTLVKLELKKRHTYTDPGELRSYLGLQITRDRARRTITLTESHMVHQVLQRFGYQFSSPQPTPLSTSHSLSAPPSDDCGEPSDPYPELVGCLMYLIICTRPDLAYPLSLLARYIAPARRAWGSCLEDGVQLSSPVTQTLRGSSYVVEIYAGTLAAQELRWLTYLLTDLGEQPRSPPNLYVDNKAMIALCQEHRLEHRTKHIALQYFLARDLQQRGQLLLAYVVTRANTVDIFTKALPPGSSLYTMAAEPPQVAASAQVSASGQVAASCSCRILSHHTLLWHHRLGHPSLPRLRGMHSRLLVSGLPSAPLLTPPRFPRRLLLCTVRLQLRERLGQDLPLLRLHSDRGGEFSSDLLRDFCRGEGILQSFTLPDSPQKNGIAERRIGLVMEVARTSMIHAAAPHFLWPFAIWYAAHQLNLWPRVSLPETSPTLRWTRKVGNASVFRVWGSRAFVCDTSADKLSARAIPCVFLGFVPDAPGWQFYHPTSRRVLPSQDVTFDESVPFYRLFPFHSAPPPPLPLFLAPGPTPVDPLLPQGPAPSGVSQVDNLPGTAPVQVAAPGAAPGAASGGATYGGSVSGGAEPGGVGSEVAGSGGAEPGGAEPEGVEPRDAESEGAESGGAEPRGGDAVTTGAGSTGGAVAIGPEGARPSGAGAARTGCVGCAGDGDPTEPGAAGAGGAGARGAGVGGPGEGGAGATGARVGGPGAGGAGAAVGGAVDPGAGAAGGTSGGLTECREPAPRPFLPVRTARYAPRSRPPLVPYTHTMALRPSSVPLCVPLHAPPESSLPEVPDPASDCARAASPTVARTSMIHAAAPHFLWPFAVQYAAHQINLQPRVSLPETTPTLRWTGNVGDASAFRVWGS